MSVPARGLGCDGGSLPMGTSVKTLLLSITSPRLVTRPSSTTLLLSRNWTPNLGDRPLCTDRCARLAWRDFDSRGVPPTSVAAAPRGAGVFARGSCTGVLTVSAVPNAAGVRALVSTIGRLPPSVGLGDSVERFLSHTYIRSTAGDNSLSAVSWACRSTALCGCRGELNRASGYFRRARTGSWLPYAPTACCNSGLSLRRADNMDLHDGESLPGRDAWFSHAACAGERCEGDRSRSPDLLFIDRRPALPRIAPSLAVTARDARGRRRNGRPSGPGTYAHAGTSPATMGEAGAGWFGCSSRSSLRSEWGLKGERPLPVRRRFDLPAAGLEGPAEAPSGAGSLVAILAQQHYPERRGPPTWLRSVAHTVDLTASFARKATQLLQVAQILQLQLLLQLCMFVRSAAGLIDS